MFLALIALQVRTFTAWRSLRQTDEHVAEPDVARRIQGKVREARSHADKQPEPEPGKKLLDLAGECCCRASPVLLTGRECRYDDVVAAHVASEENIIIAGTHCESAIVALVEYVQSRLASIRSGAIQATVYSLGSRMTEQHRDAPSHITYGATAAAASPVASLPSDIYTDDRRRDDCA
ncbi:hypothetical protein JX266_014382 [Neoarthrinium moseri]|nr:hypothetical protein JX266_014382 [Neoarthrinium moseri]